MKYSLYGLSTTTNEYSFDGLFYIGITEGDINVRLYNHVCNMDSAAYYYIQELISKKIEYYIFIIEELEYDSYSYKDVQRKIRDLERDYIVGFSETHDLLNKRWNLKKDKWLK